MTAFFGFGATPSRYHGSPSARARSPLVPSCVAPCVCATAPGGRPSGCPGNVGPEGHSPFVGRVFRACAKPGTGPVLRYLRHLPQHTMPESGRAPGPPAGPGSFFVTAEKIWVFPSFGAPQDLAFSSFPRMKCMDVGVDDCHPSQRSFGRYPKPHAWPHGSWERVGAASEDSGSYGIPCMGS